MERDKWDKSKGKPFKPAHEPPSGVSAAKEVIPPGYEEYLLLLQQRNRLLKKLKEKDEQQIEIEKKEQGFSLYVNGANMGIGGAPSTASPKGRSSSRQTKTADTYSDRKKLLQQELQYLEKEAGELRVKTAPGQNDTAARRGWNPEAVQIRTEKGPRVKVTAPGKLSGKYSEDFESLAVEENDGDDEGDDDDDDKLFALGDESSDDDEDPDELTLSFNDVETLRKSLEADESIRESIEAAQMRIKQENESGTGDANSEEDDEIEEELEMANDSINIRDSSVIDELPQLVQLGTPPLSMGGSSSSTNALKEGDRAVDMVSTTSSATGTNPAASINEPVRRERTFVKESAKKRGKTKAVLPDEDIVVLSFSSNSKVKKERILSATRRKSDAEDVILTKSSISQSQENQKLSISKKPTPDSSFTPQQFRSSSTSRSRPLSATRKSQPASDTKPDDNVDDVLKAMKEENKEIETSRGVPRTAPEKSKDCQDLESAASPARPASIGPCSSDKTISMVTEKVRQMDPRQQHQLITLLSKLELKEPPYKIQSPSPSPRLSPVKATVPFAIPEQAGTDDDSARPDEGEIDVNIEISSNWGHTNTLGVTEIQFVDVNGKLVAYNESRISLSGQHGGEGSLGNLSNGKTKTNKGQYMWSCKFTKGHAVELIIRLHATGLSKIIIWNFNRGVKDLNIGVKDVRIFIGGELTWEGTIDKGCGNQVFDYSKVIHLIEPEPSTKKDESIYPLRSKTVVLRQEPATEDAMGDGSAISVEAANQRTSFASAMGKEATPSLPVRAQSPQIASGNSSKVAERPQSQSPSVSHSRMKGSLLDSLLQSREDNLKGETSGSIIMRSTSTPNLSSSSGFQSDETAQTRGNSAALPSKPPWLDASTKKGPARSRSSSRSKSRPIWLEDSMEGRRSSSTTDVRASRRATPVDTTLRPSPAPSPVERGSSRLRTDVPTGRSYSLPGKDEHTWPDTFTTREQHEQLPTCLDHDISQELKEAKRLSDAVYGRRRDTPSPVPSNVEVPRPSLDATLPAKSTQDAKSKRDEWRMNQSLSLEESWNVLSLFEKSHRGRITKDLDLQKHDVDALDEFLSSGSPRPGSRKEQQPIEQPPVMDDSRLIDLEIPTLPRGKQLVISIKSTWGDRHYVGLNGLEVFTDEGKPADIEEVTADPPDINILPEYDSDPRVVSNLIDGVYRTRDDMHLWMAPFTAKSHHFINITFSRTIRIAMVRIWNYNKSRIHSYRGAREVEITLDGSPIFQGEIERASGTLGTDEPFGDTILFTMNEDILEAMALNDQTYEIPDKEDELMLSADNRPATADRDDQMSPTKDKGDRPFTCARQRKKTEPDAEHDHTDQGADLSPMRNGCFVGQVLQLNFVSTWGDPFYLGLTGLELFGPDMNSIPLRIDMLTACPRDLNDLPDYGDDDRTLDKIIDDTNVTTCDEHMWLIPFTEGGTHTLTIDLGHTTELLGMKVWNYNKSLDGTFRGAKVVHASLDGIDISSPEGFLLRKGPGNVHFDYAQDIFFIPRSRACESKTSCSTVDPSRRSQSRVNIKKLVPDYEPARMPTGFVFQFHLLTSWGDPYYIGLNGLEFYDAEGYKIRLSANDVTAYPHSVNVLDCVTDDARTPDKLVDGVNDSMDGKHMWLAPMFPGQINLIYVIFDEPKTVSMIKMWNYSKTSTRGVQQFGILVDDLLVYHGFLPQVPRTVCRGILPNLDMPVPHHTVLFTDSPGQMALSERSNLVRCNEGEQDVQLTNDNQVVTRHASHNPAKAADPALRPMTSVKTFSKHSR